MGTRHSLRPLNFRRRDVPGRPRAKHAARSRSRILKLDCRHCEERQRRSNPFFSLHSAMDCFASLAMTAPRHTTPTAVIARLDRAIQYSEATVIEPRGRSVLDTPHARGMTAHCGAAPTRHTPSCHPRESGDPVFQRRVRMNREAAAYWIVRSSPSMTASTRSGSEQLGHPS